MDGWMDGWMDGLMDGLMEGIFTKSNKYVTSRQNCIWFDNDIFHIKEDPQKNYQPLWGETPVCGDQAVD